MNKMIRIFLIIAIIISVFESASLAKSVQVGVIISGDIPYYRAIHKTFTDDLKSKGIQADIILQTPSPDAMAWINAARKFSAVGVDVIITYGTPATLSALSEASGIPVIFASVYDSAVLGIKGKKTTGIISKVSIAGLVKNLKDIHNFSSLGIVYNNSEKDTVKEASELERLASQFSFNAVKFNFRSPGDVSKIKKVDALFITTSDVAAVYIEEIISAARQMKIPVASLIGNVEERGILLTLSADPAEQGREIANILAHVARGESPSNIEVKNPRKLNLVINLKEASAMGFKVPFDLLSSATRIIK
ncbi:MAG: ABC transporter substrate binding protein [Nitrospirota bacterium]